MQANLCLELHKPQSLALCLTGTVCAPAFWEDKMCFFHMGTLSRIISRDDCYLKKVGVGVHSADTDLAMTPQQQDMDTLNAGSVSGEVAAILEKKRKKKLSFENKGCYGRDVPKLICHTAKTGL